RSRGRIPARRPVREAPQADGGLGRVLQQARGNRQGGGNSRWLIHVFVIGVARRITPLPVVWESRLHRRLLLDHGRELSFTTALAVAPNTPPNQMECCVRSDRCNHRPLLPIACPRPCWLWGSAAIQSTS